MIKRPIKPQEDLEKFHTSSLGFRGHLITNFLNVVVSLIVNTCTVHVDWLTNGTINEYIIIYIYIYIYIYILKVCIEVCIYNKYFKTIAHNEPPWHSIKFKIQYCISFLTITQNCSRNKNKLLTSSMCSSKSIFQYI